MATVEEIGAQLERQLHDATAKIDEFVAQQNQYIAKATQDHEQLMRDLEAKIQRLANEESGAHGKAATAQNVLAAEQRSLEERQSGVAMLEAQAKGLPIEVDAARAAEAAGAAQLQQQKQDFERRDSEAKYQLNELSRGVSFYRRLGLDFDRINDEKIRLVFTQIDPAAPERQFSFTVNISDADTYEVDDCEPAVPGMPALLQELNTGNDFSRFVQLVRRKFRALV